MVQVIKQQHNQLKVFVFGIDLCYQIRYNI